MSVAPDNLSAVIHKIIEDSFPQLVAFVQRAVSFNGVSQDQTPEHPFGQTLTDSLNDFLSIACGMGFRIENINNAVGYVEMGGGEALYGIMCHLDVVPEGEQPCGNILRLKALWTAAGCMAGEALMIKGRQLLHCLP